MDMNYEVYVDGHPVTKQVYIPYATEKKYKDFSASMAFKTAMNGKNPDFSFDNSICHRVTGLEESHIVLAFALVYLGIYVFLHGFKSLLPYGDKEEEQPAV